jgi:glycosyltransferase involved in cell wall biosynthesis
LAATRASGRGSIRSPQRGGSAIGKSSSPAGARTTSFREAFGLVLVEARACGLPVIACRAHGPAAIVADGRTGWLVPPDDEEALVEALVAAASDPEERRARGERAHAESRRYAWPLVARRFAALYEELLLSRQESQTEAGQG